jgi:hypothetical protein
MLLRNGCGLAVLLAAVMAWCTAVLAADPPQANLLTNGSFEQGSGQNVTGWTFHGQANGEPQIGLAGDAAEGKTCLSIVHREGSRDINSWWAQTIEASPGVPYTLTFKARGWGGDNHGVTAGVDTRPARANGSAMSRWCA